MTWFPLAARPSPDDHPHTVWVDPDRDLHAVRRRWEVRSAQWRAAAMAEAIFGAPVRVSLRGGGAGRGAGPFRGLLRMEVPFDDLELHRWRERVFGVCAAEDPVLSRVPLVYVFAPRAREDETAGVERRPPRRRPPSAPPHHRGSRP